ncbi:MAG: hypothetical protein LBT85_03405 [Bifidobacteriaceae bacterium]|jgi:hypothetical protein|nr:hypothetical protein [Bifidobacteriaceae bacterium]
MSKKKIVSIILLFLAIIIIIVSGSLLLFSPSNKKNTSIANIPGNSSFAIINPGILQAIGKNSSIAVAGGANDTIQIAYGNFKDASGYFADDTTYTAITDWQTKDLWQTQTFLATKKPPALPLDISTSDMFDVITTSNGSANFDLSSLENFTNDSTLIIAHKGSSAPMTISIEWANFTTGIISIFGFILGFVLLLGASIGFFVSPGKSRHSKNVEKKTLVQHVSHKVKKFNTLAEIEYDISKIDKKAINNNNLKGNNSEKLVKRNRDENKTFFNVNKTEKRVENKMKKQKSNTPKNQKNDKLKRASSKGYAHMKILIFVCLGCFTITLSSCSDQIPSIEQTSSQLQPDISIEQQQKIFSNILSTIQDCDERTDSIKLQTRLYGPAYKIRSAQLIEKNYLNKMPDSAQIPQMTDQIIISNNQGWPRTNAIITKPTPDMQSQRLLFITQTQARSNYKLWGLVRIFSNITLPKFNSALDGSQTILSDDRTLKKPPSQVLSDYAHFLEKSQKNTSQQLVDSQFSSDSFIEQLTSIAKTVEQGVKQNEGSQKQTFSAYTNNIQGIRTSDGGALIMGQIDSDWKRTSGGNRLSKPASDEESAIFGNAKATQSILIHYINVVAIYIPVKNNTEQTIQVIGAERMPVEAKPQ